MDSYTVQTWDTEMPDGGVEYRVVEATCHIAACLEAVKVRWDCSYQADARYIPTWDATINRMSVHLSGGRRVTKFANAMQGDLT